jgi:hypothetical protein
MPDLKKAKQLLDTATKDCGTARTKADLQGDALAARAKTEAALQRLSKLGGKDKAAFEKELKPLNEELKTAVAKLDKEKDPAGAIPLFTALLGKLNKACAKADLQAGFKDPEPNAEYLKLMLKEAGDPKVVDDIVKGMDDKTNRQTMAAALAVRFDVSVEQYLAKDGITIGTDKFHGTADNTAPDKSVKRVYELLLKVPESHVRDSGVLKTLRRFQEDTGGAAYGNGRISLNCGRSGTGFSHNQTAELCSPAYFPDGVEEDCQPPDDKREEEITYFDWATLHEVGHAVDDDNNFMGTNMAGSAYGGWADYGSDSTVPAQAAAGKFNYDQAYIKAKLDGGTPAVPTKPATVAQTDWDNIKVKVDEWCAKVMAENLWWDGAGSKAVAIGGRVYQRAYDHPKWVSYELAARSKGIHGYQFRAPGEWFAELYAAYYSGMLKPEHPAVKDWLPSKLK